MSRTGSDREDSVVFSVHLTKRIMIGNHSPRAQGGGPYTYSIVGVFCYYFRLFSSFHDFVFDRILRSMILVAQELTNQCGYIYIYMPSMRDV